MSERRFEPANLSDEGKEAFRSAQDAIASGDLEELAEGLKSSDGELVEQLVTSAESFEGQLESIVSKNPLPDDIEEYAGQWVAIRDGEVVAASDSLYSLGNSPDFRKTDAVHKVPPPGDKFYDKTSRP